MINANITNIITLIALIIYKRIFNEKIKKEAAMMLQLLCLTQWCWFT